MMRSSVPSAARVLPLLALIGALFVLLAPWGATSIS